MYPKKKEPLGALFLDSDVIEAVFHGILRWVVKRIGQTVPLSW